MAFKHPRRLVQQLGDVESLVLAFIISHGDLRAGNTGVRSHSVTLLLMEDAGHLTPLRTLCVISIPVAFSKHQK